MIGQHVRHRCVLCNKSGARCQVSYTFSNERVLHIDRAHDRTVRETWKVVFREMGWVELEDPSDPTRRTWAREDRVERVPPSERAAREKKKPKVPGEGVPIYRRRRTA